VTTLDALVADARDDLFTERARTGLGLCLTSIVLFGISDPFLHPSQLVPIYTIKAIQVIGIAAFYLALRRPLARGRAIPVALAGVVFISVTTSWSGIVTEDDVTTPLLLTVLTMGTATLLPWGVRPQIATQASTALCVIWIATSVGRYHAYLPIIVVVTTSVSIYMAYALERYRVGQARARAVVADTQARQHQAEVIHAARLSTLGGMAAGLAHELNQPLAAVVSYARGCARRLQAGDLDKAALLEVLEEISAQALRAGEVLRRIRDFLRGASRREWVDLNDVVRQALRFADAEVRRAGVRLDLALAPEPLQAQVDPIQIEQVILNLVQNGLEVMVTNNGTERVLAIRTRPLGDDAIEVAVSDSGAGVAPDALARLFDPFFSTKPDGLGLGLSISRSIVEAHGGRLRVTANAPRGTTVRFTVRRGAPGSDVRQG
jgi:signal transduction histidine kinase